MGSSAWGVRVSVSVADFFFGFASPAEVYTLSLHDALPISVALGLIVGVNVKVTLALTGRSTVVARSPLQTAELQTLRPPVKRVAAQVAPMTPAGSGSETLAPVTALGPGLLTTIV